VVVTDVDLDQAARDGGPMPTELADAAAQARLTDLIENLRRGLGGQDARESWPYRNRGEGPAGCAVRRG
jgi:hypothetical protein